MAAENTAELWGANNQHVFSSLCLSIRSLGNIKNFNNFSLLLNLLAQKLTFIGITETWLTEKKKGPFLNLPQYNFYARSRIKSRGGISVPIKRGSLICFF